MKDSFIFYRDWLNGLNGLNADLKAELLEAIIIYGLDGCEIELSETAKIVFGFIKPQMERASNKYEQICERNRKNGRKGGAPKGNQNARKNEDKINPDGCLDNPKQPKTTQNNPKQPKQPKQPYNDNDNDNDIIKENSPKGLQKKGQLSFEIGSVEKRKEQFVDGISPYIPKYGQKMIDDFAQYWCKEVEPDVMRFEKQKTFSLSGRLATWHKNNMNMNNCATNIDVKTEQYGIDWGKVESWYKGLGLPLAKLTDKRKLAYIMLFSSYDGDKVRIRDALKQFSEEIKKSDWLNGKSGKPIRDFEWFFDIDNFLKIIEGRYRNDKIDKHETDTERQNDRRGTFITKDREYLPEDAEF